jgi:hypothetical protein
MRLKYGHLTPAQIQTLLAMVRANVPISEIANALSVTERTVRNRARGIAAVTTNRQPAQDANQIRIEKRCVVDECWEKPGGGSHFCATHEAPALRGDSYKSSIPRPSLARLMAGRA